MGTICFIYFEVVILVYLRDQAIQEATSLADILPARTSKMSQMFSSQMQASDGHNILLIFDGWDEFPSHLQNNSLISTIIHDPYKLSLHQRTVFITSRPVSSANLLQVADRRVEILGFTQHQIREYIEKALDGNSTHIQKLVKHLEEHPVIEGYCYVPLHVAILVHIFLELKGALPTTLHELFCNLVLCSIIRELKTHQSLTDASAVFSLDNLPDNLRSKLSDLCVLAYEGVMQNKVVFYQSDLQKVQLKNSLLSLGLLQAVESLTLIHTSISYNFLHLSVQELLAAYHISQMDSNEQMKVFKQMFGGSRFQAVLQYYSGFTKLANPAIQDFVSTYTQQKSSIKDLLPLLHCFYEAQEPSLCKLVEPQFENVIDLYDRWNPVDYLAIGYYITSLLSSTSSFDAPPMQVNICEEFNNHKLMLLFLELSKPWSCDALLSSDARKLQIMLCRTTVTIERAKIIASLIEKSPYLSKLMIIQQCKIDSGALMYLAEALQKTTSHLTTLQIFGQVINFEVYYTCSECDGLALKNMCEMNKSLTHLSLSGISDSSGYIFQGLQHNTTLVYLQLSYTNLKCTEDTAQALTTMLRVNKTLTHLDISHNGRFSGSLHYLVFRGLQYNTALVNLTLKCTGLVATEDTAQTLTTMLQVNKTLTHLNLSQNHNFSDSGAYIVCQGLQHNTSLVYLNLSTQK